MDKVYILLKDTPWNKAGTEYQLRTGSYVYMPKESPYLDSYSELQILERPEWFKEKDTKWKPETGDQYWWVDKHCISQYTWSDDSTDNKLLNSNNVWPTENAANNALDERNKLFKRLRKEV